VTVEEALKAVPLFRGLDDESIQAVALHCRRRKYPKGQALFFEGDSGQSLFVILSGKVSIERVNTEGRTSHVADRIVGDHIGELALIDGSLRSADAVCVQEAELLVLDREGFSQCLENKSIVANIMGSLAARLREVTRKLQDLQALDVTGRVAALILSEATSEKTSKLDNLTFSMTQQQIAERVNATRESVNRALSKLKDIDSITSEGKEIRIKNAALLRKLSADS